MASPFSPSLQVRVEKLRHKKQVADNYFSRGAQIKAILHWLKIGNHASKFFFLALHVKNSSPRIKKIKYGIQVISELPDILQAFVQHYEQVFTA